MSRRDMNTIIYGEKIDSLCKKSHWLCIEGYDGIPDMRTRVKGNNYIG